MCVTPPYKKCRKRIHIKYLSENLREGRLTTVLSANLPSVLCLSSVPSHDFPDGITSILEISIIIIDKPTMQSRFVSVVFITILGEGEVTRRAELRISFPMRSYWFKQIQDFLTLKSEPKKIEFVTHLLLGVFWWPLISSEPLNIIPPLEEPPPEIITSWRYSINAVAVFWQKSMVNNSRLRQNCRNGH